MPRRIGEFRLLAEKVRLWLNDRDGEGRDRWPKYKELFRYLRQTCDWSGSEREYKVLRNRGYGPAMLVEGLFGYLTAYSRATLDNFLKSVGRTDGMAISARELRDEYSSVCDHAQIRTDWRSQGWRGLADMFSAALFGIDDRSLCRSAAEVCEIARWIMADVGRSVAGEEFDHTGSAEAYAAKPIGVRVNGDGVVGCGTLERGESDVWRGPGRRQHCASIAPNGVPRPVTGKTERFGD
jgi:hypothetical protein